MNEVLLIVKDSLNFKSLNITLLNEIFSFRSVNKQIGNFFPFKSVNKLLETSELELLLVLMLRDGGSCF